MKKKKPGVTNLLYFAIMLATGLLILASAFIYINIKQHAYKNSETVEPGSKNFYLELFQHKSRETGLSDTALNPDKTSILQVGQPMRDEFQPAMKTLFEGKEQSSQNIENLVDDVMSGKQIDTGHSTFGKDVIYIYHSHSREAFLPYFKKISQPEDAYHSKINITLVGEMLEKALERRSIGTIANSTDIVRELNTRELDYGSSYSVSGEQVKTAQQKNRNLEIFLDIHRDSLRKDSTTVKLNKQDYARLLFVVGTGHKEFEKNLTFTKQLHQQLETQYPGLSKGTLEKDKSQGNGVYNQNLSPNAIIIEIGGVDNTVAELHRTVEALANVLSDYYWHEEK
ncbi:stage II sporulation protein P [Planococcus kocurii]|uniref:stage II sporulation protein P n=1 Tax=Planococcus kocurii TaxID=1374 RepID=UPI003CFD99EC